MKSRKPQRETSSKVGAGAEVALFSYGTLRQPEVQRALFGRTLDGQPDILPGYALSPLRITDAAVIAKSGTAQHTVARHSANPLHAVHGTVFRVTAEELASADAYEVADCKRATVRLQSGLDAFAYVDARP